MFANLSVTKVLILFFSVDHSKLLIPFSLIPVVTSCIHEFQSVAFLLLPVGIYNNNR